MVSAATEEALNEEVSIAVTVAILEAIAEASKEAITDQADFLAMADFTTVTVAALEDMAIMVVGYTEDKLTLKTP